MRATRRLDSHGPEVPALGLGCMGMSAPDGKADGAESIDYQGRPRCGGHAPRHRLIRTWREAARDFPARDGRAQ